MKSEITAISGATAVQVAGADSAWAYTRVGQEGTITYLYAIDGPNLLVVSTSTKTATADLAAAPGLLRELDSKKATSSGSAPLVTTAGYGDLKLNSPVPSTTSLVTWKTVDPATCADNSGYYVANPTSTSFYVRTAGNSRDGDVTGIDIFDPSIQTKSGAHVGMTLGQLETLFPTVKAQANGRLYVVSDSLGQVVFDVGSKNADEYYQGPAAKNVVLIIHVLLASSKPFSSQGSEFGPCA